MKIKIYATLRQVVGDKSIDLPVDTAITMGELLAEVIRIYPGLRSELLDDDGKLLERVHILINGRDVRYLDDRLETQITAQDAISLFPAVGGGSISS